MSAPSFIRDLLTIGILFLFINSSVATNFNATANTAEEHLVTMTTQVCSQTGDMTYTIQLTAPQAKEVSVIFDILKNRLSTAGSAEEIQKIFNDTIIELDRHHLLPEDMDITQAQQLVNHAGMSQRATPLLQRITQIIPPQTTEGTIQNRFCSIAGNTSNTHVAKLAKRTALRLYYIIDYNTGNEPLKNLATDLYIIFNEISKINLLFLRQNGYHLGVCLYFGNYHYTAYPNWLSPAQGWISTSGVNGEQNITGSFWGQTMTGGWQPQVDWYMNYSWRGCLGFTGLILYSGTDMVYFLGSALSVNVGPNRP
jgi:hypothetical protein